MCPTRTLHIPTYQISSNKLSISVPKKSKFGTLSWNNFLIQLVIIAYPKPTTFEIHPSGPDHPKGSTHNGAPTNRTPPYPLVECPPEWYTPPIPHRSAPRKTYDIMAGPQKTYDILTCQTDMPT